MENLMTTEATVANGAAWLDATYPGWESCIDLGQFDIRDGCRCVLGQVFTLVPTEALLADGVVNGYGLIRRLAGRDEGYTFVSSHGFLPEDNVNAADLDEAWITLLKERHDRGTLSG